LNLKINTNNFHNH